MSQDAAFYPGGSTPALARPRSEAELVAVLRRCARVLPIGSQSSVTGGATPSGEVALSLSRMDAIVGIEMDAVRAQAGVVLSELQLFLRRQGAYFPPVPAYEGPQIGGAIATNAAGPATFKYGTTRDWVRGVRVVLANGEVVDVERGECTAHPDGFFEIEGRGATMRVPVPTYRMPDVPKRSAGYHAAPGMDLVDLFVGSEGTLGVITEALLGIVRPVPLVAAAFVPCESEAGALRLARALREAGLRARDANGPGGLDVSAVEYLDRRSLEILREDGRDRESGVRLGGANAALLVQAEHPPAPPSPGRGASNGALSGLTLLLKRTGSLEGSLLLPPGDRRFGRVFRLREAVPQGLNERIGRLRRELGADITKTGADMVVPPEHLDGMIRAFREGFGRRGLDLAIWGHVSDGNLHPNVIPKSFEHVRSAREVLLDVGRGVVELGGCPLAEHGVGRNPVKQALLEMLYGTKGIEQMRAVKRSLDPGWKLAPGNLFGRTGASRDLPRGSESPSSEAGSDYG